MKLRLAHVVPSIGEEASGPSYSVPALCAALGRRGHDVHLHTAEPGPALWPYEGVKLDVHHRSRLLWRLVISGAMREGLKVEAKTANILHNHSLWVLPNIYPARAIKGTACHLVVSPRGTLSEAALRFSPKKKWFMWNCAGQKQVLDAASCIHATSETERDEVWARKIRKPVAVIPNGVDLPTLGPPASGTQEPYVLFLSRIHPKKGLLRLIDAWRQVERSVPDWKLVIAGRDNGGHQGEIEDAARRLGCTRVTFPGPAFGASKHALYSNARVFVYPTFSENFGMVVAEALAHSVPVICSTGAPWQGLETHDCGWWVDGSSDSLAQALTQALKLPLDSLAAKGRNGRRWMESDFSWDSMGQKTEALYYWLLGNGPTPSFVFEP